MHEPTVMPLNALDEWFFGAEPLDLVVASPGVPNLPRVADSFRAALRHVPHYASRLGRRGDQSVAFFDPTAPELHINAPINLGWRELADEHIALLAPPLTSRLGGHTVAMAVTRLTDGFAVCLSGSHVIGDARSFVTLLRTWLYFHLGATPPPVSTQRGFKLQASELAQIDPALIEHAAAEVCNVPSLAPQESLRLSAQELEDAKPLVGGSLHQAATLLLLRAFRARLFASEPTLRLRVPSDVRGVLPGLSDAYVGNAFLDAFVEITCDDVDGPPARIVAMQREAIAQLKRPDVVLQLLRLEPHGLQPTEHWAQHQHRFDPRRDVVFGSLVGRVAPAGVQVDLGHGNVRFLPRTSAPRGFLVAPDRAEGLMVQVRL